MDNSSPNTAPESTQAAASSFDAGKLLRKLLRYWWLFVLSFAACFGIAFFYLNVTPPVFLIRASVLVGDDDGSSTAKKASGGFDISSIMGGVSANVQDEIIVMGSESLVQQMVEELGLNVNYSEKHGFMKHEQHYRNSPIVVEAPKELYDTLSTAMVFKIKCDKMGRADIKVKKSFFNTLVHLKGVQLPVSVKTPYGIFSVQKSNFYVPGKAYNITASVKGYVSKAEDSMADVDVQLYAKKSDGISLGITDSNVQRGRDILNTLMRLYNEKGLKDKDTQAIATGKFIDDRINLIYKDLIGSESEIEAYKKAHNMVDPEIQGKAVIGKQTASENAIVALQTQYRIMSMIRDFIANPANKYNLIPFEADSTAASGSVSAYNRLVTERMRLAESAKDDNAVMHNIDKQLAVTRANVLRGVKSSMQALNIRLAQAESQEAAASDKISQVPTTERETRALYRQQGIQNELYTYLLQKREENALKLASTTPKAKIVDKAYASSKPVKPKVPMVLFLALCMAVFIPVTIIYLLHLLNTKFSSQDDLEEISAVPVIGHVHHNRHKEALVVRQGKTSAIVELFRYLRNNVQFMLTGPEAKVVLVTSSTSGEGKSFVSSNLAASFALLEGKKVVLVGMDIRSPKLADMLHLKPLPGVTSYLAKSDMRLDEIVQHMPGNESLDVIVAGAVPPNPSELLLGDRTGKLIAELRERYDYVIIDSAPVAQVSDTFSVAGMADATVYVTRANYTKRSMVKLMNRLVATKRLANVGAIVNDTKPSQDNSYGYGYGKNDDDK